MDKMKLAHEYALEMAKQGIPLKSCKELGWKYADAMQAEADKRNKTEAEQKRKEIREMLNAPNTFVEREGQHFDDVEEWQPDWSQAPKEYHVTGWYIFKGVAQWIADEFPCGPAPTFGFTGTHIVERPHGF